MRYPKDHRIFSPYLATQKIPPPSFNWEWFKHIGIISTLLGIMSWILGACFTVGYWEAAGYPGPLIPMSIQMTALNGFISTFKTWQAIPLLIAAISLYWLLTCIVLYIIVPTKGLDRLAKSDRFKRFVRANATQVFAGLWAFAASALLALIIAPLSYLSSDAVAKGKAFFTSNTCALRAGHQPLTTIKLNDSTNLAGLILDRSEKQLVLMDKTSLYIVNTGDKNALVATTALPAMTCPNDKQASTPVMPKPNKP